MNDYDRGAYTPHNDAPLSFDARQSGGRRGFPTTLVISLLILVGLGVAIFMFYRSGVRGDGAAPVPVGAPVGQIKAPAPDAKTPPEGDAAGLQIYKSESPGAAPSSSPVFAAGPEQPRPRPAPKATAAVPVAVAPVVTHAAPAPPTSPAMVAASGATMKAAPAPAAVAAKTRPAPGAAPGDAIGDLLHAKPAQTAPVAHGAAMVQIGAYSSTALASKGWSDIAAGYGAAMSGKGKVVEPVAHDGKTLFRTAISGFGSRADAVAFCVRLKADGHACIVK